MPRHPPLPQVLRYDGRTVPCCALLRCLDGGQEDAEIACRRRRRIVPEAATHCIVTACRRDAVGIRLTHGA